MFMTRLCSSVVLVVLSLVTILTGGYLLAGVLLFLALTAFRELTKACKLAKEGGEISALEVIGYLGILAYYLLPLPCKFYACKVFFLQKPPFVRAFPYLLTKAGSMVTEEWSP